MSKEISKETEIDDEVNRIMRLCQIVLDLVREEHRAITTAQWSKLDFLVRRKGKLLQKMDSVVLEHLDNLYVFDKRVTGIRDLIQDIVSAENENAILLKTQMEAIKVNMTKVKYALQNVMYSQPVVS